MPKTEIHPCWMCGEDDLTRNNVKSDFDTELEVTYFLIICPVCGHFGPDALGEEEAIEDWNAGLSLPDLERKVNIAVASLFDGLHNAPEIHELDVYPGEKQYEINTPRDVSTWDSNLLTILVVVCHDLCIRATVEQSAPNMVKIVFSGRNGRTGRMHERHPNLERGVEIARQRISRHMDSDERERILGEAQ